MKENIRCAMYIAVLDEFPDFMVPTLVARSVLGAHLTHCEDPMYKKWLTESFMKRTVRVNQKEFDKIAAIPGTYLGHESKTLGGKKTCAIPIPMMDDERPNVLKFAHLWKPK